MAATDRAARALDLRLASVTNWPVTRPARGWIRAIRDALGLTTRALAERMGVSQPRIVALERGEVEDTITLATLRRAAEALDCTVVYALVPNSPLAETLRRQAGAKADARLSRVGHTMKLENQALSQAELSRERQSLVEDYLRGDLRRLWDKAT